MEGKRDRAILAVHAWSEALGSGLSETLAKARKTMWDAIAAFNREIQFRSPRTRQKLAPINFINVKTPSSFIRITVSTSATFL